MSRMKGYVSTSATTEAKVNATTYTEQTSGAQRSLKSSSASDAAAGTGVRTVKITYFTLGSDGSIAGPYYETVTMNGATAVATVATNIALIEQIEAVTVGSNGSAVGTIALYTDNAGAGSAIASIAIGDLRTWYAHRYIPGVPGTANNPRMRLVDAQLESNSTGTNPQAYVQIRSLPYPSANAVEAVLAEAAAVGGVAPSTAQVTFSDAKWVQGPARLQAYVTPRENSSQITRVDVGLQAA